MKEYDGEQLYDEGDMNERYELGWEHGYKHGKGIGKFEGIFIGVFICMFIGAIASGLGLI